MINGIETRAHKKISFEMNLDNAIELPKGDELFQLCARAVLN